MAINEGRTALYRLLAANGRLLYVGISGNPDVRWGTHSTRQPWWAEVADRKIEWFTTRNEALEAEVVAIKEERPLYNKQHSVVRPRSPLSGPEFPTAQPARVFRKVSGPPQSEEHLANLAVIGEALNLGLLTCADFTDTERGFTTCKPSWSGCDRMTCAGSIGADFLASAEGEFPA